MRVGYARVSTIDQSPELQLEALRRAGCEKIFTERASGARDDRPELARVLADVLRPGDTLVTWKEKLSVTFTICGSYGASGPVESLHASASANAATARTPRPTRFGFNTECSK